MCGKGPSSYTPPPERKHDPYEVDEEPRPAGDEENDEEVNKENENINSEESANIENSDNVSINNVEENFNQWSEINADDLIFLLENINEINSHILKNEFLQNGES